MFSLPGQWSYNQQIHYENKHKPTWNKTTWKSLLITKEITDIFTSWKINCQLNLKISLIPKIDNIFSHFLRVERIHVCICLRIMNIEDNFTLASRRTIFTRFESAVQRLQKWIGDFLPVESPFSRLRAIIATTLAMFNRQCAENGEPYGNLKVFEMSRATTWC